MREPLHHPTADELTAFSTGGIDDRALATIQAHIAQCVSCRAFLKELPPDGLVTLLRDSMASPDTLERRSELSPSSDLPFELPLGLLNHPRYRVLARLGAGGMGEVFKAEHRMMKRLVALKVINPRLLTRPGALTRFRREVEAVGQLSHRNIAAAHDADQVGETHFLVMEYVEGRDLATLVKENGPLPVALACDCVWQAAAGLQHAHACGLVHRDVKPHNLMLTADGQVKILDFGLAALAGGCREGMDASPADPDTPAPTGGLTDFGEALGTADFAAPEQIRDAHSADVRADVYGLGCTLYYLLEGKPPLRQAEACQKIAGHPEQPAASLSSARTDVPPALAAVVERMMARDPTRRYQTPAAVAEALTPFLKQTSPLPRAPEQHRRRVPSRRWLGVYAAVSVCLVVLGWALWATLFKETAATQITLDFNSPVTGSIADKNGLGTGFMQRLPGTGTDLPTRDPNLELASNPGRLLLTSTRACTNQYPDRTKGTNLGQLEAPAIFLPNVGSDDVIVSARCLNLPASPDAGHLALFVGTSCTKVILGSFHALGCYTLRTNKGHGDFNHFTSDYGAFATDHDVVLTLQRVNRLWSLSWENLTDPTKSGSSLELTLPWIDDEPGLYVGLIHGNPGVGPLRTVDIRQFRVQIRPKH